MEDVAVASWAADASRLGHRKMVHGYRKTAKKKMTERQRSGDLTGLCELRPLKPLHLERPAWRLH